MSSKKEHLPANGTPLVDADGRHVIGWENADTALVAEEHVGRLVPARPPLRPAPEATQEARGELRQALIGLGTLPPDRRERMLATIARTDGLRFILAGGSFEMVGDAVAGVNLGIPPKRATRIAVDALRAKPIAWPWWAADE